LETKSCSFWLNFAGQKAIGARYRCQRRPYQRGMEQIELAFEHELLAWRGRCTGKKTAIPRGSFFSRGPLVPVTARANWRADVGDIPGTYSDLKKKRTNNTGISNVDEHGLDCRRRHHNWRRAKNIRYPQRFHEYSSTNQLLYSSFLIFYVRALENMSLKLILLVSWRVGVDC
jgi:hypothetical protein